MIDRLIEYLHVTPWDWIAVTIALFSFVVAVISCIVAFKTFFSQKQTAKNTTPTITVDIQKFLLEKMFVNLLESYISIVIHQKLSKNKSFDLNKTEEIIINQKIPESLIHSELFYKDKEKFHKVNLLAESIANYNENLHILRLIIHDNTIESISSIQNRLERLRYKCQIIIMQWKLAMIILYDDVDIVETVEKNFFIMESIDKDESYKKDNYGFGDKLVSYLFIKDKDLYDSLIIYMNQRASILEEEYRKYLLNDYERN